MGSHPYKRIFLFILAVPLMDLAMICVLPSRTLADVPASAQKQFSSYYFAAKERGRRDWFTDGQHWYERELNGNVNQYEIVESAVVNNTDGTVIRPIGSLAEFFLPNRSAHVPLLFSRKADAEPWQETGDVLFADLVPETGNPAPPLNEAFELPPVEGGPKTTFWYRVDPDRYLECLWDGNIEWFFKTETTAVLGKQGSVFVKADTQSYVFIPDPSPERSFVMQRNEPNGDWAKLGMIHPFVVSRGDSGAINLPFDLAGVLQPVWQKIPTHFDESGHPEANDYRWDFDMIGHSAHIAANHLILTADFSGDIETRSWIFGCHLKPVYPHVTVDIEPILKQDGNSWFIEAKQPNISTDLGPGSDTSCSIFDISLRDKLMDVLNGEAVKNKVVSALADAKVPISIDALWNRLNGPIMKPINNSSLMVCLYPRPQAIELGPLMAGDAGTGEITDHPNYPVLLDLQPIAVINSSCATDTPTPFALSSDHPYFWDNPDYYGYVDVSVAAQVSYSELKNILDSSELPGQLDIQALTFEGHRGFISLSLRTKKPLNETLEFWIFPTISGNPADLSFIVVPEPAVLRNRDELSAAIIGAIARKLASAMHVNVAQRLADLQHTVNGDYSINNITLHFSDATAVIRGFVAMTNHIDIAASVMADTSLEIH